MTSSPAQPHVGGLDAHPFLSQTGQRRAEREHIRRANASQKKKFSDADCQRPLQQSPSLASARACESTRRAEGGNPASSGSTRETETTGRIQLREKYFPHKPMFFPDQQVTASPNSPQSTSSLVHTA